MDAPPTKNVGVLPCVVWCAESSLRCELSSTAADDCGKEPRADYSYDVAVQISVYGAARRVLRWREVRLCIGVRVCARELSCGGMCAPIAIHNTRPLGFLDHV